MIRHVPELDREGQSAWKRRFVDRRRRAGVAQKDIARHLERNDGRPFRDGARLCGEISRFESGEDGPLRRGFRDNLERISEILGIQAAVLWNDLEAAAVPGGYQGAIRPWHPSFRHIEADDAWVWLDDLASHRAAKEWASQMADAWLELHEARRNGLSTMDLERTLGTSLVLVGPAGSGRSSLARASIRYLNELMCDTTGPELPGVLEDRTRAWARPAVASAPIQARIVVADHEVIRESSVTPETCIRLSPWPASAVCAAASQLVAQGVIPSAPAHNDWFADALGDVAGLGRLAYASTVVEIIALLLDQGQVPATRLGPALLERFCARLLAADDRLSPVQFGVSILQESAEAIGAPWFRVSEQALRRPRTQGQGRRSRSAKAVERLRALMGELAADVQREGLDLLGQIAEEDSSSLNKLLAAGIIRVTPHGHVPIDTGVAALAVAEAIQSGDVTLPAGGFINSDLGIAVMAQLAAGGWGLDQLLTWWAQCRPHESLDVAWKVIEYSADFPIPTSSELQRALISAWSACALDTLLVSPWRFWWTGGFGDGQGGGQPNLPAARSEALRNFSERHAEWLPELKPHSAIEELSALADDRARRCVVDAQRAAPEDARVFEEGTGSPLLRPWHWLASTDEVDTDGPLMPQGSQAGTDQGVSAWEFMGALPLHALRERLNADGLDGHSQFGDAGLLPFQAFLQRLAIRGFAWAAEALAGDGVPQSEFELLRHVRLASERASSPVAALTVDGETRLDDVPYHSALAELVAEAPRACAWRALEPSVRLTWLLAAAPGTAEFEQYRVGQTLADLLVSEAVLGEEGGERVEQALRRIAPLQCDEWIRIAFAEELCCDSPLRAVPVPQLIELTTRLERRQLLGELAANPVEVAADLPGPLGSNSRASNLQLAAELAAVAMYDSGEPSPLRARFLSSHSGDDTQFNDALATRSWEELWALRAGKLLLDRDDGHAVRRCLQAIDGDGVGILHHPFECGSPHDSANSLCEHLSRTNILNGVVGSDAPGVWPEVALAIALDVSSAPRQGPSEGDGLPGYQARDKDQLPERFGSLFDGKETRWPHSTVEDPRVLDWIARVPVRTRLQSMLLLRPTPLFDRLLESELDETEDPWERLALADLFASFRSPTPQTAEAVADVIRLISADQPGFWDLALGSDPSHTNHDSTGRILLRECGWLFARLLELVRVHLQARLLARSAVSDFVALLLEDQFSLEGTLGVDVPPAILLQPLLLALDEPILFEAAASSLAVGLREGDPAVDQRVVHRYVSSLSESALRGLVEDDENPTAQVAFDYLASRGDPAASNVAAELMRQTMHLSPWACGDDIASRALPCATMSPDRFVETFELVAVTGSLDERVRATAMLAQLVDRYPALLPLYRRAVRSVVEWSRPAEA